MPGYLLHQGAITSCAHGGLAQPILVNPRVTVMGQSVALSAPYGIQACSNPKPPPPGALGPCITAQWSTTALRVKVMGQPLLLSDGSATCAPTGVPLIVQVTQLRVKAI